MASPLKKIALILAASGMAATAAPAMAVEIAAPANHVAAAPADSVWHNNRNRGWDRDRYRGGYDRYQSRRGYRDERVNRNTRVWRGRDGHAYCRKSDGTTGLIIGAAAGALLGREVDGGYDRTLGTILGGAAGALLGKEVDSGTVCR